MICNPRAGRRVPPESRETAVRILEEAGWRITLRNTEAPHDATRIAQEAVNMGADAVLVAGGDGTVNEVIQALAGSATALGYLPSGTMNVWARELKLPLKEDDAARSLVEGTVTEVDLGIADGRHFLLMAGIGFDGAVLRRAVAIDHHKHRFGVLPYVAAGLTTVPRYHGSDVELRYDGLIRRVHALMLVVGNTRLYGGLLHLTPDAVANDGLLDLCIVKGRGPLSLVRNSLPLLLLRKIRHADVEIIRLRALSVHAAEPMAVQLDGELHGHTPVHFGVAHRSLKVIIPRNFASGLISR